MKRYKPYKIRYYIGIRKRQKGILEPSKRFYIIKNPLSGWCADPFIFEYKDCTYIFAEKWDYIKQKGIIAYTQIKGGKTTQWEEIIEEPYHLSYPNIWRDDKGVHICAESSSSGEVYTYTAVDFPNIWRKDKIWWRGNSLADTTILFDKKNSPQWLFTYGCSGLVNGKLFRIKLNSEQEVEGNLLFVSRNKKVARPGGKFIFDENSIYRVAQNCSKSYGRSISICKVLECTEKCYKEKFKFERSFEYMKTDKKLKIIGMHTYNCSTKYEVVDFRVNKFGLIDMFFYILKRLKG